LKKAETSPLVGITGAAGFIGRHLAAALLDQGFRVRVLLHQRDLELPVEKVRGSLLDSCALEDFCSGLEVVFNLAAVLGNRLLSERDFFAANARGTGTLVETALAGGVSKFIHFSSAGVYGKSSGLVPLTEDAPLNPVDVYERSKLAGEHAVQEFAGRISVSTIRPGWIYGPGDERTFKLIRQINSGLFFIAGSGRLLQSPTYVSDLVRAALILMQRRESGEIFNIGDAALSIRELVCTIAAALGKSGRIPRLPMALVLPAAALLGSGLALFGREAPLTVAKLAFFRRGKPLNSDRFKTAFSFEFEQDFESGMAATIAWYREQGWL